MLQSSTSCTQTVKSYYPLSKTYGRIRSAVVTATLRDRSELTVSTREKYLDGDTCQSHVLFEIDTIEDAKGFVKAMTEIVEHFDSPSNTAIDTTSVEKEESVEGSTMETHSPLSNHSQPTKSNHSLFTLGLGAVLGFLFACCYYSFL